MELSALISAPLSRLECEAAIHSFFHRRGYLVRDRQVGQMTLLRPAKPLSALSWRAEDLKIELYLRWAEREGIDETATLLTLNYQVNSSMRLWSHMDRLYFELETEEFEHELQSGENSVGATELDRVRKPIAIALMFNVVTSVALATAACTVIGLGLVATVLISLGVALINFVSILGFADLLIQGMDELAKARCRLRSNANSSSKGE